MKRKIFLLLLIAMSIHFCGANVSAALSGNIGNEICWTLDYGTLTISGSGDMEDYTYNDAPWYSERSTIKSVKIGNGVTKVGSNAFRDCVNLSTVNFGNTVEFIGDFAFYNTAYKSVAIPSSLKKIGVQALGNYETISVASGNDIFSVSGNVLFTDEGRTLLYYPGSILNTSYTIPYNVEEIASRAFNNSCLATVTLSSSAKIVKIGDYAFYNTPCLSSLKQIPTSLREVGKTIFYKYGSMSYRGTRTLWNKFVACEDTELAGKMSYGSATHPNHPICGDVCKCTDTHHVPISWSAWNGKSSIGNSYYYLSADVTRTSLYNIYGTACICLNDHQINTNGESEGFTIQSTGNLTVTDCGTNGKIISDDGDDDSSSSAELAIYNEGKFKLYNGSLSAGAEALYNVSGASAIIYGGSISGTDTAVWNLEGGDCNILGGTISCEWDSVENSGTCTIENAELNGTLSNYGDLIMKNVSVKPKGRFANAIYNGGTFAAEKISIQILGGNCGNSICNSGTMNLKDVTLPTSKGTYRQYFGVHNISPKARCYLYGKSNVSALGTDYSGTFSFASSDGKEKLADIGVLSLYVNGENITNSSTIISNISEKDFENITQINLDGKAAEEYGVLKHSNNSVKFIKYAASGTFADGLTWKLTEDGELRVSGNGSMKNEVPWRSYGSSIKKVIIGNGVTDISESAFHFCPYLTEAVIGNNVSSIGKDAFCTSKLENIEIPDSVLSIGAFAFEYCPLKNVTIGKGLKEIGRRAFRYNNTEEYMVDGENLYFKAIDGNLYSKDGKTLVKYAIGKNASEFTIPEGVTGIGAFAFEAAINLKNVVIPKSVADIGEDAFWIVDSNLKEHYLDNVYYFGTEADWEKINISYGNYALTDAKKTYSYCYTKTSVAKDRKSFVIELVNIPRDSCVILALYKDGELVEVQSAAAERQFMPFFTDVSYDDGKVLVWKSLLEPVPLCADENIE